MLSLHHRPITATQRAPSLAQQRDARVLRALQSHTHTPHNFEVSQCESSVEPPK